MGTAFDFFANKLGDTYGGNLLINGEAEPGTTSPWTTYGGATIVVGGVGIYGDYVFKLPSGGSGLEQSVTPSFTPAEVQIYGFFYCQQYLVPSPSDELYIEAIVSYNEDSIVDVFRMPINVALTNEYAGNYFEPSEVEVNYYLAKGTILVRENKTIVDISITIHNGSDTDMYCDNIAVRLNNNNPVAIGAYTNEPLVDKYGINPKYLEYFKNMVYNSSFEIFDATTLEPTYWTGGVSDPNSNFSGSYSLKLLASESSIQSGDGIIDPSFYENERTRVSFHSKLGHIQIEVYDETNDDYFTLTAEDGTVGSSYLTTPKANWQDSMDSVSFDPTEFGSCTALKIKFTNTHASETGYIDDVMLAPDFTGKWPQLYKDGPRSYPAYIVDEHYGSRIKLWTGTEAEYAAIVTPDPRTLYFCTED